MLCHSPVRTYEIPRMAQILARVIDTGPSGHALNSSFSTRDTPAYKQELGEALLQIAKIVPDGMLVFFASYSALNAAIEAWKMGANPTIWYVRHVYISTALLQFRHLFCSWRFRRQRLARWKYLVVEPKEHGQFAATRTEFESKINGMCVTSRPFFVPTTLAHAATHMLR
jgi:regulator of telomere elongation helicase 1